MNNKYNINFKRLALLMLPTFLRKRLVAGLAYALISPLSYIHLLFMDFRKSSNYRLNHNSQVCYLRAVLNDMFDPSDRRIVIVDLPSEVQGSFIYLREMNYPVMVPIRPGAIILNRRGFGGTGGYDFVVEAPSSTSGERERMKSLINTYKLASKRYTINYF